MKDQAAWDFAVDWYDDEEVLSIASTFGKDAAMAEYPEWLKSQLRHAMSKGIQIGRQWESGTSVEID